MQLIDANDVYKIIGDTGIKRVHVTDIDQIKRIDPESLPVVQQLRAAQDAAFRVRAGAVRGEVLRRLQKTGALPGEGVTYNAHTRCL